MRLLRLSGIYLKASALDVLDEGFKVLGVDIVVTTDVFDRFVVK